MMSKKKRFQEALKQRLVKVYSEAFKNYKDQKVLFKKRVHYRGKNIGIVRSLLILSEQSRIPIDYHLYRKNAAQPWKIYDMDVDGISMVSSLRSSTERMLHENNLDLQKAIESLEKTAIAN